MNKLILTFALLFSASVFAFADDAQQVITLKDGSQIKGTLAGIADGIYTVKTPIIGDVHVAANDVASITNGNVPPPMPSANSAYAPGNSNPGAMPPNMGQLINTTQQQLMSNPQSMAMIQQMAQNPEIVQALQDPALQQAIANHDYQALQSNPVIQKLMNDPSMQALAQQMSNQQKKQ